MKGCYVCILFLFTYFFVGCSSKYDEQLTKKILAPESVEIYDINVNHVYAHPSNRVRLLKKFPFISNQPVIDFRGKFSDEFYDKIDYRYKAAALQDVDFWNLRTNPFSEDFIYVLPIWVNKFQKVSKNLFENIGYSYNLSLKEQEILKWWIGQGGILWIEGGIYSTRYDTFKKNGEIASKEITKKIIRKSKNMNFFDTKVNTYIYKSKIIDLVNYIPLKITFHTHNNFKYFQDIKNLKIQTQNYLNADFLPQAETLVYDNKRKPLVSFISYGRGGVVFLRPFEFKDKRYDGELLRWKLLYFLLNKMYVNNHEPLAAENITVKESSVKKASCTMQKLEKEQHLVLHNLEFMYKSFHIKKGSLKLLEPVAEFLKKHPNVHLLITGHTDNIGSKQYNKRLSIARAKSVKKALLQMGIAPHRISTIGYGEEEPIASNKTPNGRAKNRRVEFWIIKK